LIALIKVAELGASDAKFGGDDTVRTGASNA
jgi:hypothetical protein